MPRGLKKPQIEVRRDPPRGRQIEGEIDEVCGRGEWHFEMMNDSCMSVMLYGEAGDVMCLFIEPKRQSKFGSPHVRASVSWHDTPAERRRFKRDFQACQKDPLAYIEMIRKRRRALATKAGAVARDAD